MSEPRLSKVARESLELLWESMDSDEDVAERTALRCLLDWYDDAAEIARLML